MGKRKSEDNPTTTADGESNKRQRLSEGEAPATKKSKKEKKDKKYKKEKRELPTPEEDVVDVAMTEMDDIKPDIVTKEKEEGEGDVAGASTGDKADKKKKRKKNKKKAAAKEESEADGEAETKTEQEGGGDGEGEGGEEVTQSTKPKKNRFIVFVGNLPYSATVSDIEKHFAAVQPTSIRLLHEKANPSKSRGIAFLEFSGFDYMKTCLKTMHHTTMTSVGRDYRGRPKTEERQINVELTAGGGGNTDGRKEKIRAKNEKLNDQRERRRVEEEKQKIKKEQERLAKGGEQKSGADGIHPSRRGRVPGGRFK